YSVASAPSAYPERPTNVSEVRKISERMPASGASTRNGAATSSQHSVETIFCCSEFADASANGRGMQRVSAAAPIEPENRARKSRRLTNCMDDYSGMKTLGRPRVFLYQNR